MDYFLFRFSMAFPILRFRFRQEYVSQYTKIIILLFVNITVYLFTRFTAFARFIVIEITTSIFAQRESIFRVNYLYAVFL